VLYCLTDNGRSSSFIEMYEPLGILRTHTIDLYDLRRSQLDLSENDIFVGGRKGDSLQVMKWNVASRSFETVFSVKTEGFVHHAFNAHGKVLLLVGVRNTIGVLYDVLRYGRNGTVERIPYPSSSAEVAAVRGTDLWCLTPGGFLVLENE
jgi:alpha-glucuronidase